MVKGVGTAGSRFRGMENVEMKKLQIARQDVWVCMAVTLLMVAGPGMAQTSRLGQRTAGPAGGAARAAGNSEKAETVKISRMPPPGKTSMVRTPEFNYNVQNTMPRVTRKPREWALFEVKYETSAKWMDELKFDYHVMTKGKNEEGKEAYSYYTTSIRYVDIPKGDHMSSVAIPPSLAERYGEPVAVALEITGKDGTVLASESPAGGMALPKEWWKDSKVLDNPNVTRRTGMIDRSKTPFALVNPDDYEVVQ